MLRRRNRQQPARKDQAAEETVQAEPTHYRSRRMKPPYEDEHGERWPFGLFQGDKFIRPHKTRRDADRDAAGLNRLNKEDNRFRALLGLGKK